MKRRRHKRNDLEMMVEGSWKDLSNFVKQGKSPVTQTYDIQRLTVLRQDVMVDISGEVGIYRITTAME